MKSKTCSDKEQHKKLLNINHEYIKEILKNNPPPSPTKMPKHIKSLFPAEKIYAAWKKIMQDEKSKTNGD